MSTEPDDNEPDIPDDANQSTKERQRVFVLILKTHEDRVGKIVRKYCKRRDDSEELTQEIIANLWAGFPRFRYEANITTWVYSVTQNTVQKYLRSKRYRIVFTGQTIDENVLTTTEDAKKVTMEMDMEQLKPPKKRIAKLIDEGFSFPEIASMLEISIGALYSWATRSRKGKN